MTERVMTTRALQNVLVDAFNASGEGVEIDLYDALCAEMCREYETDGDTDGMGGDNPNFDGPAVEAATFRDAGVMTTNAGLVVRIGSREFQLSIVRSR